MPKITKGILLSTEFNPYQELTKEVYDLIPNGIFHKGYGFIEHPWFNDATKTIVNENETVVKFVLHKSEYTWCCVISLDANFEKADYLDGFDHLEVPYELIYKAGQKVPSYYLPKLLPQLKVAEDVMKLFN